MADDFRLCAKLNVAKWIFDAADVERFNEVTIVSKNREALCHLYRSQAACTERNRLRAR
ncbi:Uncharacterised protein [Vibrio cholerae]|uniref:Uncharacterized protein n=1 Tax=Vibrio cholerae TaxID=666 RepID=A0A655QBY7_VIBCL|nr:Uncharacterised protein [Vibrio cholerae]CSA47773.1 Uncharacterised protein [Vibrio cholerae]CSB01684.1 Uncharacterised protein [Vibrio cholerae]CSC03469.1 Uncharacterised protein [Vibrio cholerae]CSD19803.1 Uncharacterised protein [Vibrio cholerae]